MSVPLDNMSVHSAPAVTLNGDSGSWKLRHKRTQSSCLPATDSSPRPVSSPPDSTLPGSPAPPHYGSVSLHTPVFRTLSTPHSRSSLSTSPSITSYMSHRGAPFLSSSNPSLLGSQQSLVPQTPPPIRPASLYVPFVGCVDAPRPPPGQAAREVLNALSFAPTQDSYASDPTSPALSPKLRHTRSKKLTVVPQSPKLRSKSSSLVSLMGPSSPGPPSTNTTSPRGPPPPSSRGPPPHSTSRPPPPPRHSPQQPPCRPQVFSTTLRTLR